MPVRLLKAVDELSDEEHARLTDNADRVNQMATEAGQSALLSVVQDRLLVEELENAEARSLWVFLNEPNSFQHAEQVCYTDGHRYGARMWSGYEGPKDLVPDATAAATVDAFAQAARKLFGSLKAHCEIYRRTRPNFDQPDSELHQLTLYHDDLPDTYLEFELEQERPVRRHRRPVVEVSITYEPATGVIEVVASAGKLRDQLARIFADTILRQEIAAERIAVRRFDLSRLLQPFDFPFDPADGIESVKLVLLRLHRDEQPEDAADPGMSPARQWHDLGPGPRGSDRRRRPRRRWLRRDQGDRLRSSSLPGLAARAARRLPSISPCPAAPT